MTDTKFKKGNIPWNKGKPHPQTPEQIKKRVSLLPRGVNHHLFGKHHKPETIKKIVNNTLGKKKGPFTEEHKKNMSLSARKRKMLPFTEEHKRNLSKAQKGRKVSEETRKKIGKSNTKNGLTPFYTLIRHSFEYRQWSSDVFKRDDWTCQKCLKRGGTLHAHHIKEFYLILKENNLKSFDEAIKCSELWDLNNGQTLCVECHKQTESFMRKPKKYEINRH
jgi:hypothetical protein